MKTKKPGKANTTKAAKPQTFAPIAIRSVSQLGNAIRRIRRLQNLSQTELSKKAGVTQATISRMESGAHKAEISTVLLLMAALNADLHMGPRPKVEANNNLEGLF